MKSNLLEAISTINKIQEARKNRIVENLKTIFSEGDELLEKQFGNIDMLKQSDGYLRRVLTDYNSGKGIKLFGKNDLVYKPEETIIDVDKSVDDILNHTELSTKGNKYSNYADKFTALTGLKWTDIDKSVYSGQGGKGMRRLGDWSQDAQEAIQIQLLTGKIQLSALNEELITDYLNKSLVLSREVSVEDACFFLDNWKDCFEKDTDACERFLGIIEGKDGDGLSFDINNCTIIHQAIPNEYNAIAKKILSNKTAAIYDKADAYIMANDASDHAKDIIEFRDVTDNNSFLTKYEAIRKDFKHAQRYAAISLELAQRGILLGVSLKQILGNSAVIEYDPRVPEDTFTGNVVVCKSNPKVVLNKKDGKYYRNLASTIYVNFELNPGVLESDSKYIVACIRPNGSKGVIGTEIDEKGKVVNINSVLSRLEWREADRLNAINGISFGSGTSIIEAKYGSDFGRILNSGEADSYEKTASFLLNDILGMEEPVVFNPVPPENPIVQQIKYKNILLDLFCQIAGYTSETNNSTAVYIKVY